MAELIEPGAAFQWIWCHSHTLPLSLTHSWKRVCFNNTRGLCEWNEGFTRLSVTIKRVRLWWRDRDKKTKRTTEEDGKRGRERHTQRQTGSVRLRSRCLSACRSALHSDGLREMMTHDNFYCCVQSKRAWRQTSWQVWVHLPIHLFSLSSFLHSGLLVCLPSCPSFPPRLFLFCSLIKVLHPDMRVSKTHHQQVVHTEWRSTQPRAVDGVYQLWLSHGHKNIWIKKSDIWAKKIKKTSCKQAKYLSGGEKWAILAPQYLLSLIRLPYLSTTLHSQPFSMIKQNQETGFIKLELSVHAD